MDMAGSSNVSEETEWKYKVASAVNVSNFVLIKLSWHCDYKMWKAQMLSLIESQELLHIIYPEYSFPGDKDVHMISMYDILVKGWILSTVGERLLLLIAYLDTAGEVWKKLESIFGPPKCCTSEEEEEEEEEATAATEEEKEAERLDETRKKEDDKYLKALVIEVSDYVTVKLSKPDNYDIWKSQMLCLLKRKKLIHIIDEEYPFPEDKGVHMISKYEKLVKSWIFTTMDEQLLEDFKDHSSVRYIWADLEYRLFQSISFKNKEIERKYKVASDVSVSNFVTVKLKWEDDYKTWKAQMLCLIECQELLHIINAEHPSPVDELVLEDVHMINSKFDKLVKGWILSTLDKYRMKDVQDLGTAREVWLKLVSIFDTPKTDTKEEKQYKKYRKAIGINVSDFVLVKFSDRNNYDIWKSQMLQLIEREKLLHIIIAEYPFPENKGVHMISKYDKLVKAWFFTTMEYQLLKDFIDYSSVQSIWKELESRFIQPITYKEQGDSVDVSALREDLKYIQVSNVNVSNFVSVKLSGQSNFSIWKAQMMCLLKSQQLLHITEAASRYPWSGGPMTEKYDNLVKGWIFGTMNDQLLQTFSYYLSVQMLWKNLESKFNSLESDSNTEEERGPVTLLNPPKINGVRDSDTEGFTFSKELSGDIPEIGDTRKKRLYEAAVEGCWWKAKSILKIHNNAATEDITETGNRILHVAVEMGHNYFVKKLLEFLKEREVIKTQNKKGRTALHIAALVDNVHAAQLLVEKVKELLEIRDSDDMSPLDIAYANRKLNISTYLLKSADDPSSALSSEKSGYPERATYAIQTAIFTKQYDLTRMLLQQLPISSELVMESILMAITVTFPTDLGFVESFIYPSFSNVWQKIVLKDVLQFKYKCVDDILMVMDICNNACCGWLEKTSMILLVPIATLYPIYQLICLLLLLCRIIFSILYFLLWKVLANTVGPIKNIEKKKTEYKEAKEILKMICDGMDYGYDNPMLEAVSQGTYEVVDEILFNSPRTINCEDEAGHNVIQLAIMYRSEKVYNLVHHIIERTESYRTMKDSFGNNLVHLAGKLAPSLVLSRTTGAALQLQRELIWREELEKLMLPLELLKSYKDGETPAMVFTKEHKDLMKQGEAWMKTTAESCSITAALIVTVVFAAAITVPGGSSQESGIPVFKKESAFTIFALFNAFSLFTAAASLLLFLSILTARFSERDFLVSLPRRLILGLLTLFLSTTAMIVAFGAILFLVFCDHRPWMLAPICVFACLPISIIVTIKLPLLADLIQSTYIPIFSKQRYIESCKTSRKNTIFTK